MSFVGGKGSGVEGRNDPTGFISLLQEVVSKQTAVCAQIKVSTAHGLGYKLFFVFIAQDKMNPAVFTVLWVKGGSVCV